MTPSSSKRALTTLVALGALAISTIAPPMASAQEASVAADITLFEYQPAALQVATGTTVTWTNHDAIVHSITEGTPASPGGLFDSGLFDQDGTYAFTFSEPGDYAYFCARHNFMQGRVSVG